MTAVTGSEAVYLSLVQALAEPLSKQTLELVTENGSEQFDFALAAPNIARVLLRFYDANNRAPAIIFNDGNPSRFAADLASRPGKNEPISWAFADAVLPSMPGENNVNQTSIAIPVLNVRVSATGRLNWMGLQETEQGPISVPKSIDLHGLYNSRYAVDPLYQAPPIPLSMIQAGAAPTWAVLLVAITNPDFLSASDDGILLTPDGIAMVEKSLSFWVDRYTGGFITNGLVNLDSVLGTGPVMLGFPAALADKFRVMYAAKREAGSGYMVFFKWILSVVLSFIGFYAGVAGLSGMVAGQFTLPNLSGMLNLADRVGVDVGKLQLAVKLLNLTPDTFASTIPSNSTGNGMFDWFDSDDVIGDESAWYADASGVPLDSSWSGWSWESVNPGLSFDDDLFYSADYIPADLIYASPEYGLLLSNQTILTPDESLWFSQNATDPTAQASVLQAVTDRVQQVAADSGFSFSVNDALKYATQVMGLASQWQMIKARTAGTGAAAASGARVATNPDGSRTVTYADGRTVTLPATYTSPGMSPSTIIPGVSDTVVYVGGIAAVGLLALSAMKRG